MIREATVDDIPVLVEMARKFHSHANMEQWGLTFDPPSMGVYIEMLIFLQTANIFVLEEEDGIIVGSIAGILNPWFMDYSIVLVNELWWWVEPGSKGTKAMKEEFYQWAKSRGTTKKIMNSISGPKEKVVQRYYKMEGLQYMESMFIGDL